ncbi:hypothetical protein Gotur_015969 [Gossypium turneri]
MGWHELLWVGRLLVLMQLLHGVFGWGKDGHLAVCKIAEEYLTKDALATVKELLPDSARGELASVCSWADDVRWHYHWSSPLHYVDTPDFKCNYKYCRKFKSWMLIGDCHDTAGHKDRCVTGAIFNYTKQLFSAYQGYSPQLSCKFVISPDNLTEALMFLAHFIGDVHQVCALLLVPLNLKVWDTMIIDSAVKTLYGSDLATMIQAIQRNITDAWSNDVSSWKNCGHNQTVCPNVHDELPIYRYASESVRMACKFAYRNATPGSTLEDGNITATMPSKHMTGLLAFSPCSMTDSVPEFGAYMCCVYIWLLLTIKGTSMIFLTRECYLVHDATLMRSRSVIFFMPSSFNIFFFCSIDEYFLSRLPIVEKRLAQGGIRLAAAFVNYEVRATIVSLCQLFQEKMMNFMFTSDCIPVNMLLPPLYWKMPHFACHLGQPLGYIM